MPDTTVRKLADPHLAAIRMVTQAMRGDTENGKLGSQLEGARFNLYSSLESEDYDTALNWLNTLEVGLGFLQAGDHPSASAVDRALRGLRVVIEEETEEEPEVDQE